MLGDRIASLRLCYGMSQAELAKRLHISASAVGMYEQGRREPSVEILIAISQEFGVTLDYLLKGQMATVRDVTAMHRLMEDNCKRPASLQKKENLSKEEIVCHLLWALLE